MSGPRSNRISAPLNLMQAASPHNVAGIVPKCIEASECAYHLVPGTDTASILRGDQAECRRLSTPC